MASITTTIQNSLPVVGKRLRSNVQTYGLIAAVIILWVIFGAATQGTFLSPRNISNVFRQMTVTALLSVGMVLVIVSGNIDLSVGNLAGFVSVVVVFFQAIIWPLLLKD